MISPVYKVKMHKKIAVHLLHATFCLLMSVNGYRMVFLHVLSFLPCSYPFYRSIPLINYLAKYFLLVLCCLLGDGGGGTSGAELYHASRNFHPDKSSSDKFLRWLFFVTMDEK